MQEYISYSIQAQKELQHNETVEFLKLNHDEKFLLTGGMSNFPRVFDMNKNFELKQTLDGGSSEDNNFVRWHPKGNVVLFGGKDKSIWLFNGINGDFISCCLGHEGEVLDAQFTLVDNYKQIISISEDMSLKVWQPMKGNNITTIKGGNFHASEIGIMAQLSDQPVVLTGDRSGKVFYSNYATGEPG